MGSFNEQCSISKETIMIGDEVVSIFLERDVNVSLFGRKSEGESRFKLSSLPVFGVYSDYGSVTRLSADKEPLGQSEAIEIAKSIYKYDYSENAIENYGGSYSKEGGVSPFQTNTLHWVIKKACFDEIWAESDFAGIVEKLNQGDIEAAFNHNVDIDLMNILASRKDSLVNLATDAAILLDGLRRLNIELGLQTRIAGTSVLSALDDYQIRKKMHAGLKINNKSTGDLECFSPVRYTCSLSGKAVSPGDSVYVLPLQSNHSHDMGIIANVDKFSVIGQYSFNSAPIKCLVQDDGKIVAENLSKELIDRILVFSSSSDVSKEPESFIENLLAGHYDSSRRLNLESSLRGSVLSEEAYETLMQHSKYDNYLSDDYDLFVQAAESIDKWWSYRVQIENHSIIMDYEDFDGSAIDDVYTNIYTLSKNAPGYNSLDTEMLENDFKLTDGTNMRAMTAFSFFSSRYDISSKCPRGNVNNFSDMVSEDSRNSLMSYDLRKCIKNQFVKDKNVSISTVAKELKSICEEFSICHKIAISMNKFGLGIEASSKYVGEESISDQRAYNQKVRGAATDNVMKKLKELSQDFGLSNR